VRFADVNQHDSLCRLHNVSLGRVGRVSALFSWLGDPIHRGVVLDVSSDGFDMGAATSGSIFIDDDSDNIFLFYTGAQDAQWSHTAIGLATSKDGVKFQKVGEDPILEGSPKSFCHKEALAPTVTRMRNRFFMVFTGKPSPQSFRRLGIAYADDPKGPWQIIGELIRPTYLWEGRDIDNGLSLIKLSEDEFLIFYSSITSPKVYDVFTILRRYTIRRIGIAKVKIRGTSTSSIEVYKSPNNPLKHLNGQKGSWNESLFCPGYMQLSGRHFLFPATSTYSIGFPYKQYLGIVSSDSPHFPKNRCHIEKLIDGPSEKYSIFPSIKGEIALDTPSPMIKKDMLFLYYSVADRANEVWKVALTTFNI